MWEPDQETLGLLVLCRVLNRGPTILGDSEPEVSQSGCYITQVAVVVVVEGR